MIYTFVNIYWQTFSTFQKIKTVSDPVAPPATEKIKATAAANPAKMEDMSVKVDLARLADVLADFPFGYLITVGDDYRAHTVAVEPVLTDGRLDLGTVGRHTRQNTAAHPDVTLVWPPREPGGYSLIVDGRALPAADTLTVEPVKAVLHRKATEASPATSPDCLHDCVPLKK